MQTLTFPEAVPGMADATILRWLKRPGERVTAGEAMVEVQTRRDVLVIQAPAGGTLAEILAGPGATVRVGEPLARLAGQGEAAQAVAPPAGAPKAAGPPGAVVPILMPKAGNTMEEGTIVAWHVKEGQRVQKGQVLYEVETDKAVVEVEAEAAGRIARIVALDGQTVPVLQPVAYMAERDEDVEAFLAARVAGTAAAAASPAPAQSAASGQGSAPARPAPSAIAPGDSGSATVKASPAARKLAGARGIDLSTLGPGRGPGGRILSTDVTGQAPSTGDGEQAVRRPMSRIRKAIARNLTASKQTVPHFYIELTIDAGPLMDLYRQEKAKYPLSINDVLVAACAAALMEFPAFRRRVEAEQYVEFPSANIGLAVALEDGLVVPVVLAAERMGLPQLASETRRLVEAARAGRIENLGQGVMTISNLGMFGTERFSAIINPPEASILAVGAVREEPVVSNGAVRPGKRLTLTLSCDHRVVDGVIAAKFLGRLKELLEKGGQSVER